MHDPHEESDVCDLFAFQSHYTVSRTNNQIFTKTGTYEYIGAMKIILKFYDNPSISFGDIM